MIKHRHNDIDLIRRITERFFNNKIKTNNL